MREEGNPPRSKKPSAKPALRGRGVGPLGSSAPPSDRPAQIAGEIRRALAKWKNARDRVPALILADGADLVGTPGLLVGGFTVGGSTITYTLDLVVGGFVVGATPRTDPDGPWAPILGHSNLV